MVYIEMGQRERVLNPKEVREFYPRFRQRARIALAAVSEHECAIPIGEDQKIVGVAVP